MPKRKKRTVEITPEILQLLKDLERGLAERQRLIEDALWHAREAKRKLELRDARY